jgi:hypothetical protein
MRGGLSFKICVATTCPMRTGIENHSRIFVRVWITDALAARDLLHHAWWTTVLTGPEG